MESMLKNAVAGILPTDDQVLSLADYDNTRALADAASLIRDQGFQNVVTYSRKVFIPLTHSMPGRLSLLHLCPGTAQSESALSDY